MEKKIKFENIIAFILKAMEENYEIDIDISPYIGLFNKISIKGKPINNAYKKQSFSWKKVESDKLNIIVNFERTGGDSNYIIKVENRKDILKWETLVEEVIDYCHSKIEEDFENFFEEEDSHPKNIDDLDDKDD